MRALRLLLTITVFIFAVNSYAIGGKSNGGDAVYCKATGTKAFPKDGYYFLDYVLSVSPSGHELIDAPANFDIILQRIHIEFMGIRGLEEKFRNYLHHIKNTTDWSKDQIWPTAKAEIDDYRLLDEKITGDRKPPENCHFVTKTVDGKEVPNQVVIRREEKRPEHPEGKIVVFNFDQNDKTKLGKTSPLQLSFLYVHEFLWEITQDIDLVTRINHFVHTKEFFELNDKDKVRRALQNRGLSLRNIESLSTLNDLFLRRPLHKISKDQDKHVFLKAVRTLPYSPYIVENNNLYVQDDEIYYSEQDINDMKAYCSIKFSSGLKSETIIQKGDKFIISSRPEKTRLLFSGTAVGINMSFIHSFYCYNEEKRQKLTVSDFQEIIGNYFEIIRQDSNTNIPRYDYFIPNNGIGALEVIDDISTTRSSNKILIEVLSNTRKGLTIHGNINNSFGEKAPYCYLKFPSKLHRIPLGHKINIKKVYVYSKAQSNMSDSPELFDVTVRFRIDIFKTRGSINDLYCKFQYPRELRTDDLDIALKYAMDILRSHMIYQKPSYILMERSRITNEDIKYELKENPDLAPILRYVPQRLKRAIDETLEEGIRDLNQ